MAQIGCRIVLASSEVMVILSRSPGVVGGGHRGNRFVFFVLAMLTGFGCRVSRFCSEDRVGKVLARGPAGVSKGNAMRISF